jgi:hypothetical protein
MIASIRRIPSQTKIIILVIAFSLACFIRLFVFIYQKSVNILFWDTWDTFDPLFQQKGVLDLALYQHDLHRMGLGAFVIHPLAELTHWNARADSYAVLGLIALAFMVALYLKKRLFGSFSAWDVILPIIFFTATQFEILIGAPDEAVMAMPLLLLLVYALVWTGKPGLLQYSLVVLLNFFLIYTGYGFLIAPITITFLAVDTYHSFRMGSFVRATQSLAAILLSFVSIGLFLSGYRFGSTGAACSGFKMSESIKYPVFMAVSVAKFAGVDFTLNRWAAVGLGLALVVVMFGLLCYQGLKVESSQIQENRVARVCAILISFSLIFGASAAVGRTCLGMGSATSSRYMTMLIPAFVGLYFGIFSLQRKGRRTLALAGLLVIVSVGQLPYGKTDLGNIAYLSDQKEAWRSCYLQHEDIDYCNQTVHIEIYPGNREVIKEKLDYLKRNRLNLYLNDPSS